MKTKYISVLMLFCFVLVQCKGAKDYSESTRKIALEKLGEDFECIPNEDSSYTLCMSSMKDESNSGMGATFFVVDNTSGKILFEESIDKGAVSWYSSSKLSLFYTPGIMRNDQSRDDFTFIYDLITEEKVPKKKLESK